MAFCPLKAFLRGGAPRLSSPRPALGSLVHGRVCNLAFRAASRPSRARAVATACVAAPATELRTGKPKREEVMNGSPENNVSDYIYEKMGMDLHRQPSHPIGIIKQAIYDFFEARNPGMFKTFDDRYPIVTTRANFDEVLVPADHISRSPNDTYYVDASTVLRCHTSAHQAETLRSGQPAFLVTGDVYRRDSIDATHYPVFHQMEGVRVFSEPEWVAAGVPGAQLAEKDLKDALEGLAKHLFGEVECRWIDAYFPFTEPSFELEIFFKGKWLEVLGCGVMEQVILDGNYKPGHKAWAFGLGLERLAMVLFDVPDIRLFWSNDDRFLKQFRAGDLSARFKPYSKFPSCYKDMAFWVSPQFSENNLCELVRNIGGDLVEEVTCIDTFTNKKTGKTSNCYRIVYRSMERSLTDEEINALQDDVRKQVAEVLKVELR
ncbi:Phenylalanine--tRNA ligase, chloroplastic/mitochondrial [Tetrabaena socialis]|uniref:phenylalanine--tRNA ligase n=1 Tax=Tetrabaena socialis TaxID=47790 RepID=A0A2J8A0X6_9CHLO|nr:Phenylalanine--tRNA ligase, chloroplastic/mitochondrial [Tetrabaena socialis]|eukprot:PNH06170.1 Phenylalanine--tRNA ligase, chloroplastic/mitochondrial [Tetrabaena socialis]